MGGFDAHYGAVGSGIRTGTFVKMRMRPVVLRN